MLILTRRNNQSILIGDDVEVRVVSVDKGQVRLGITAPDDVKILRDELLGRDNRIQ